MKKTLLLLLLLPFILFAQNESQINQISLNQNIGLIEQLSYLAPMGINPYLTVFLTSLCSKIGFHNDYIATNPFFNNWFIVILSGILFLFTALVGTIFKTNKVTSTVSLADTYLSNNAALIINAMIILVPIFLSDKPSLNETVYKAGFLSFSLKTLLILVTSMYFLIVVMTVKFSIDILIFLSPFPFIGLILEIIKIVLGISFVLISIVSPTTSIIISIIIFFISLFFYRSSVKLVNKIKYLIVYPILNVFREKQKILTNGKDISILVFTNKKTEKIKKGKIVRLERKENKYWLIQRRFLLSNIEENVSLTSCFFLQNHLNILLEDKNKTISLILNRSYHKYLAELSDILSIEIQKRAKIKINKGLLNRLKNMFSKRDLIELKSTTK